MNGLSGKLIVGAQRGVKEAQRLNSNKTKQAGNVVNELFSAPQNINKYNHVDNTILQITVRDILTILTTNSRVADKIRQWCTSDKKHIYESLLTIGCELLSPRIHNILQALYNDNERFIESTLENTNSDYVKVDIIDEPSKNKNLEGIAAKLLFKTPKMACYLSKNGLVLCDVDKYSKELVHKGHILYEAGNNQLCPEDFEKMIKFLYELVPNVGGKYCLTNRDLLITINRGKPSLFHPMGETTKTYTDINSGEILRQTPIGVKKAGEQWTGNEGIVTKKQGINGKAYADKTINNMQLYDILIKEGYTRDKISAIHMAVYKTIKMDRVTEINASVPIGKEFKSKNNQPQIKFFSSFVNGTKLDSNKKFTTNELNQIIWQHLYMHTITPTAIINGKPQIIDCSLTDSYNNLLVNEKDVIARIDMESSILNHLTKEETLFGSNHLECVGAGTMLGQPLERIVANHIKQVDVLKNQQLTRPQIRFLIGLVGIISPNFLQAVTPEELSRLTEDQTMQKIKEYIPQDGLRFGLCRDAYAKLIYNILFQHDFNAIGKFYKDFIEPVKNLDFLLKERESMKNNVSQ